MNITLYILADYRTVMSLDGVADTPKPGDIRQFGGHDLVTKIYSAPDFRKIVGKAFASKEASTLLAGMNAIIQRSGCLLTSV